VVPAPARVLTLAIMAVVVTSGVLAWSYRTRPRRALNPDTRRHLLSVTASFAIGSSVVAAMLYLIQKPMPAEQLQGAMTFFGMWAGVVVLVCGLAALMHSFPLWRVPLVRALWLLFLVALLLLSVVVRVVDIAAWDAWVTPIITMYLAVTITVSVYGFCTTWLSPQSLM
jgi:hypothetical protein